MNRYLHTRIQVNPKPKIITIQIEICYNENNQIQFSIILNILVFTVIRISFSSNYNNTSITFKMGYLYINVYFKIAIFLRKQNNYKFVTNHKPEFGGKR